MKKTILVAMGWSLIFAGTGYSAGQYLSSVKMSEDMAAVEGKMEVPHAEMKDAHEPEIVEVGRILVPIYKPRTVNYIVATLGIAVNDPEQAEFLRTIEGATQIRSEVLTTMIVLAETSVLTGPSVNTEQLSELVLNGISEKFDDVEGVLFMDLSMTDVARG